VSILAIVSLLIVGIVGLAIGIFKKRKPIIIISSIIFLFPLSQIIILLMMATH
jgi:hypothetical protein